MNTSAINGLALNEENARAYNDGEYDWKVAGVDNGLVTLQMRRVEAAVEVGPTELTVPVVLYESWTIPVSTG